MSSVVEKVKNACNNIAANSPFALCPGYYHEFDGKRSITGLPSNYKLCDFTKELRENAFNVLSIEHESSTCCVLMIINDELFEGESFRCILTLSNGNVVGIIVQ
jgi:hypothetical protein